MKTNQKLHSWNSKTRKWIQSQACTYDSRYLFTGYQSGVLTIFDLEQDKIVKVFQALHSGIYSITFTKDCQQAYISDDDGNLKTMMLRSDANPGQDFKFTKDFKQIGSYATKNICLTDDEKNQIVGSRYYVRVVNIEKGDVTKEFKISEEIRELKLIGDGMSVLVAESNGNLTIIDLKTMKVSSNHQQIVKDVKSVAII